MLPANMDFGQFIIRWTPIAFTGIAIYLFVQRWMCHPEMERGIHLKGMLLKFACWPVFFWGFVLALLNKKIPYIPTAKQAVSGFTPFVRPLIYQQVLFAGTIIFIVIQRRYLTHEAAIALSGGFIWAMLAFASIAFLMSLGGLYAAWKSRSISSEEPWKEIELNNSPKN
jgi:cellulose synthase (UDP-forming)